MSNRIKTIIVDDEIDSVRLLQLQLQKHCTNVDVIHAITNPLQAIKLIEESNPDLVFMDIEMPLLNGFELLEQTASTRFAVVFITAYNNFALRAFRYNALDYIVKPPDTKMLCEAVEKASQKMKPNPEQLSQLQQQMNGMPINKLAIPSQSGVNFIHLNDIEYIEANNNYSKLFLLDKKPMIISKTLKHVQDILESSHFLRIHRQYVINLHYLKQLNKNEGIIIMESGAQLPIAHSQKEVLTTRFKWL